MLRILPKRPDRGSGYSGGWRLPKQQANSLKQLAKDQNVSASYLLELAVESFLFESNEHPHENTLKT